MRMDFFQQVRSSVSRSDPGQFAQWALLSISSIEKHRIHHIWQPWLGVTPTGMPLGVTPTGMPLLLCDSKPCMSPHSMVPIFPWFVRGYTSKRGDSKVHKISSTKTQISLTTISLALLAGLGYPQPFLNDFHFFLCFVLDASPNSQRADILSFDPN